MIGMALTKSVYTLPTWTRTVALVSEHAVLRAAIGCPDLADVPSIHACYRFTAKLRAHQPLLDACLDRVAAALHEQIPDLGATVAVDGSDMPAYANGQRYLYKGGPERKTYSDPDASWGHRSAVSTRAAGSFYRLQAPPSRLRHHRPAAGVAGGDGKGCRVHLRGAAACVGPRAGVPRRDRHHGHRLRPRNDLRAVRGARLPPGHPAARDPRTAACSPASKWIKAHRLHTLIPRKTLRWKQLYRQRGAVERENGRLKNEWGLSPLRVRRIERVQLHADLTILARLATALATARAAVPLAA
jgi:hypothetical protein